MTASLAVRSKRLIQAMGSQKTLYVGTMKGIGRIYQQTFLETYSKVASAKLFYRYMSS